MRGRASEPTAETEECAKRRKLADTFAPDDYAPGAIYRVTMHNFMTYSHAELSPPGPRLNCIVGPNGTGKSSIVNALAIVLGGSLKITERGDRASDAIKHGCDSGWVEIELRDGNGPGRNLLIRADLVRESNKCNYSIDGKKCTKTEVKTRVSALGISIDNMLQFLPQDKVIEFTKMTPKELLTSTMKATMPEEHAEHLELITLSKRVREVDSTRAGKEKALQDLKAKTEKLATDVERVEEYERNVKKKDHLQGKAAWLKVLRKNAEHKAVSAQYKESKKEAVAREAEKKAAEPAVAAAMRAKKEAAALHTAADAEQKKAAKEIAGLMDAIEGKHQDELDRLDAERTRLTRDEVEQQGRVQGAKDVLRRAKDELARQPTDDEIAPKIKEVQAKIAAAQNARSDLEADHDAVRAEARAAQQRHDHAKRQLDELQDSGKAKAAALYRKHEHASKVERWVAQNSAQFERMPVGPIGLHIDVVDEDHAYYLEKAVNDAVFGGFIVFTQKDRDLLQATVRREKWQTNVYAALDNAEGLPQPPFDAGAPELARLGVTGWLHSGVQANAVVKSLLCRLCGIHQVLVGSAALDKNMDALERVLQRHGRSRWNVYTPHKAFSGSQSRYGAKKMTTSTTAINRSQRPWLLSHSAADADALAEAREAEQGAAREVDEKRQQLEALGAEVRKAKAAEKEAGTERQQLSAQAHAAKHARERVAKLERELAQRQKEAQPEKLAERRAKLRADLTKAHEVCARKAVELPKAAAARERAALEAAAAAVGVARAAGDVEAAQEVLAEKKAACDAAERAMRELIARRDKIKSEVSVLFKAADELCPEMHPVGDEQKPEDAGVRAEWDAMPDDDDAIADEVRELDEQIARSAVDLDAVSKYHANKRKIAHDEQELAEFCEEAGKVGEELSARRDAWEPKVRQMASTVSTRVGELFAAFNCVGEVELAPHPTELDEYELRIKVKWRAADPLHVLSSSRDSGGECSVATMVYLIALQDVNPCPFRVVDEINQAMDRHNERRIFEVITKATACQRSKTQYLLITPKLLPDLHYSKHTALHFVFNGPFNPPCENFNLNAFAPHAKASRVGEDDDGARA